MPEGAAARKGRLHVEPASSSVGTLLVRPEGAWGLYVLAHGAGAGMHHPFMEATAAALAAEGVATLRYQFPYMERGTKRPDRLAWLTATVRAAVEAAAEAAEPLGLPLFAGGKSMGGRMTSLAASEAPLPAVRGLAFLGFPLHSPAKPGSERAAHLKDVGLPMLFLQGSRDALARLELLRPVLADLGAAATLHVLEGGDHSFKVPKKSGRTADEVMGELAGAFAAWARPLAQQR